MSAKAGWPCAAEFEIVLTQICNPDAQFDFLEPPTISLYGIEHSPDSEHYKMEQFKRAVHEVMGTKYPTLQDIVKMSMQEVEDREKKKQ